MTLKQLEHKQNEKPTKIRITKKYRDRPDAYLFEYRGYKKIVYGCCCRFSAKVSGIIHWLQRNSRINFHRQIRRQAVADKKRYVPEPKKVKAKKS